MLAIAGCGTPPSPEATPLPSRAAPASPPSAAASAHEPERTHDVRIDVVLRPTGSEQRTFWLYRPEPMPDAPALVIIAPAGGTMLGGAALSPDDREEHTPYVRAGMVVMAYSIDGEIRPGMSGAAGAKALEAYRGAGGGIDNARQAIDVAFERVPNISPDHVYAAGADSAGALALVVAAEEPRVRGVLAYGPVTRFDGDKAAVMQIDRALPGFATFFRSTLPENRVHDIDVPVFIFQTKTDAVVRASQTRAFADALGARGAGVDYVEVPSGDHRESMLQVGIPRAISWLQKRR